MDGTRTPGASTETHTALCRQLAAEVEARFLAPLDALLDGAEPLMALRRRLDADAQMWAAQILGPDRALARSTAARVLAAVQPFDPDPSWWRTPFGQAVVRLVGHPGRASVSRSVAGAMLGITRQGVQDLVNRGKLARHPDGGVSVASIRDRAAR
ncbi:hypothetical protein GCM10009527_064270 [Actinomadura nitritigenes]|uniref:Helix-turn-helix domain-containing protein n=1 Tax=Actinomadura nitritigenes TaxID=134602 RepID=A0ABS3RD31_9ACTN|nr:hypothetical protein [Actinomadura nitritigenes]MBO2444126.1 hypothetical protein [Actinomadura nitritigenes]